MENPQIIVKIEAPELVQALNSFIAVLVEGMKQSPSTPAVAQPLTGPAPVPLQPMAPATTGVASPVTPPTAGPAPVTTPTYTMEQLAVAATALVDAGKRQDLIDLLGAYGVRALTELPKERYGEFATALRGIGGKI